VLSLEADSAVPSFTRENQAGGLLFIHLFIHDIVGCLSHAILMKIWLKSIHFIAFLLKIIKQHHFTQSVNFSKPIISPSPSYPHHIPIISPCFPFFESRTPQTHSAPRAPLRDRNAISHWETVGNHPPGNVGALSHETPLLSPWNDGLNPHETPLLPSGYDSHSHGTSPCY